MKTAIIGTRTATDYALLVTALKNADVTEVISGGAAGADALAERYAKENNKPLRVIKANWARHGRAAGPLRNAEIVEASEQVYALWDGKSAGTADTIRRAKAAGKPCYIIRYDGPAPQQMVLF